MNKISTLSIKKIREIIAILNKDPLNLCISSKEIKEYDCMYKKIYASICDPIWSMMKIKTPWLLKNNEAVTSASISYIGLLAWRIVLGLKRDEENGEMLDYNIILLYLACDYILDDKTINNGVKKEMECRLEKFIQEDVFDEDEDVKKNGDYRVNDLMLIVQDTLRLEPKSRKSLISAWVAEKNSVKQLSVTSFEKLWNLSSEKGFRTVEMAAKILNKGEDLPNSFILGSVTQHVDDLVDYASDKLEGINTAATICMEDGKCLDYYLYRCLKEIDTIPDDMWPFRMLNIQIVSSCGFFNPYTSNELKNILYNKIIIKEKYNLENFVKNLIISNQKLII